MGAVRTFCLALLLAVLTGCAASVSRPSGGSSTPIVPSIKPAAVALHIGGSPTIQGSSDWQTFRAEWRSAFTEAAREAGYTASYLETLPTEQPDGTILVDVNVKDYRYLTAGARYGFGIMTGNAYVNADAQFIEFPGNRTIGTRVYSTSSTAWQGVFSAMTAKQLRAISDAMLKEFSKHW